LKLLTNDFRENHQYNKFALLIEVALAMTKLLQRAREFAGPELSMDLDAIVSPNYLILFCLLTCGHYRLTQVESKHAAWM
jgi:hypothetical protein